MVLRPSFVWVLLGLLLLDGAVFPLVLLGGAEFSLSIVDGAFSRPPFVWCCLTPPPWLGAVVLFFFETWHAIELNYVTKLNWDKNYTEVIYCKMESSGGSPSSFWVVLLPPASSSSFGFRCSHPPLLLLGGAALPPLSLLGCVPCPSSICSAVLLSSAFFEWCCRSSFFLLDVESNMVTFAHSQSQIKSNWSEVHEGKLKWRGGCPYLLSFWMVVVLGLLLLLVVLSSSVSLEWGCLSFFSEKNNAKWKIEKYAKKWKDMDRKKHTLKTLEITWKEAI